jgi:hypothetical protein
MNNNKMNKPLNKHMVLGLVSIVTLMLIFNSKQSALLNVSLVTLANDELVSMGNNKQAYNTNKNKATPITKLFTNYPVVQHDPLFSTHSCINSEPHTVLFEPNGTHPYTDWHSGICIFRNIVWQRDVNTEDGVFTYHQNPDHIIPWDFPWGTNLAQLHVPVEQLTRFHFTREVQASNLPISSTWKRLTNPLNDQQGAIIVNQDCTLHSGHSLGGGVWPVANSLFEMRMLSTENIIIWAGKCKYHSKDSFQAKFWQTIAFKENLIYLDDLSHGKPVVIPLVVTGLGGKRLLQSYSAGSIGTWVRDRAYHMLGFPPGTAAEYARQQKSPRILLIDKTPEHRILNLKQVAAHLRKRFPRAKIDVVFPRDLSVREEISMAESTTILITPPGGTSYIAPYLRDGSVAIFSNICWPGRIEFTTKPHDTNSQLVDMQGDHMFCSRNDNYIWSRFPHFHKLYLGPISRDVKELVYEENPHSKRLIRGKYLMFSYNISLDQIEMYVNEGLLFAGVKEYALTDRNTGFTLENGPIVSISFSG